MTILVVAAAVILFFPWCWLGYFIYLHYCRYFGDDFPERPWTFEEEANYVIYTPLLLIFTLFAPGIAVLWHLLRAGCFLYDLIIYRPMKVIFDL